MGTAGSEGVEAVRGYFMRCFVYIDNYCFILIDDLFWGVYIPFSVLELWRLWFMYIMRALFLFIYTYLGRYTYICWMDCIDIEIATSMLKKLKYTIAIFFWFSQSISLLLQMGLEEVICGFKWIFKNRELRFCIK